MRTPAQKAFTTLAANLKRLGRLGDIAKLSAFMASPTYSENFARLSATQKVKLGGIVAEAYTAANKKLNLPPLPRYSKRGWRWWTPERIAQLRALDARTGSDEAIARAFGISYKAALTARWRYCGPRVAQEPRMAA